MYFILFATIIFLSRIDMLNIFLKKLILFDNLYIIFYIKMIKLMPKSLLYTVIILLYTVIKLCNVRYMLK